MATFLRCFWRRINQWKEFSFLFNKVCWGRELLARRAAFNRRSPYGQTNSVTLRLCSCFGKVSAFALTHCVKASLEKKADCYEVKEVRTHNRSRCLRWIASCVTDQSRLGKSAKCLGNYGITKGFVLKGGIGVTGSGLAEGAAVWTKHGATRVWIRCKPLVSLL